MPECTRYVEEERECEGRGRRNEQRRRQRFHQNVHGEALAGNVARDEQAQRGACDIHPEYARGHTERFDEQKSGQTVARDWKPADRGRSDHDE